MRHFIPTVRRLLIAGGVAIGLLAVALDVVPPASAAGKAPTALPLSLFLEAQGTQDVWYPPEPALFAWTGRPPNYPRMGWIDYVGAADRWLADNGYDTLGTTVTGTFSRKDVGNGLYEYSVVVHATNALAWCVRALDEDGVWDGTTMLFGAHVQDVAEGATPALGRCTFKATWRQDQDTPIADINLASNYGPPYRPAGWALLDVDLRGTANGPLHEAAGLGPEGTAGKMVLAQQSSNPQAWGNGNGNADGYPSEVTDLLVVGN